MTTFLEIIESYHNGQKSQFVEQVKKYGAGEFAKDLANTTTYEEAYSMLKTFIVLNQG